MAKKSKAKPLRKTTATFQCVGGHLDGSDAIVVEVAPSKDGYIMSVRGARRQKSYDMPLLDAALIVAYRVAEQESRAK